MPSKEKEGSLDSAATFNGDEPSRALQNEAVIAAVTAFYNKRVIELER